MKKILLLIVAVLFATSLFAENVNQNKAKQVAKAFVSQHDRNAAQLKTDIVYSHPMPNKRDAAFYVVNIENSGFIIVAANDVAHPVIGYSFDRPWPTEGNIPPQITDYLDDLAGQIEAASQNQPDQATKAEWQELLAINPDNPPQPKGNRNEVGPLLTTTWDQGQYYNAMCPEDANGPDGHAVTGCVATAMAQIINYHQYPKSGRGTHSYQSNYGTLTMNYETETYDYTNMPNALSSQSTEAQVNAVAQLIRNCGIAVNMGYTSYESSAYDQEARAALINFFKYSPDASFAEKAFFSVNEWDAMLKTELDAKRPVFYSGRGTGGHAFVCDGYNSDGYYHFNFGWSGSGNTWYLLDAVNPLGMNFNSNQSAILGITPDSNCNVILGQMQGTSTFTVDEPLEFYHLMGHNQYEGNNYSNECHSFVTFISSETNIQLALYVIEFKDQLVNVYDGTDQVSLLQSYSNNGGYNMALSTQNALTLEYSGALFNDGFELRIKPDDDCRMVSNINAAVNITTVSLSWTENGDATQWEVEYGEEGFEHGNGTLLTVNNTDNTIEFPQTLTIYDVYVRSKCSDNNYSDWLKCAVNTDAPYWHDVVISQPESFTVDEENHCVMISSVEDFVWYTKNYVDYDAKFVADIDMGNCKWKPFEYSSELDGDGHKIYNVFIKEEADYVGLMDRLRGIVKNLGIENAYACGRNFVGVLCGDLIQGNITNCYVINSLVEGDDFVAGLAGSGEVGMITNSYVDVEINSNFSAALLIGRTESCELTNCYAAGMFKRAFGWTGGIVAYSPFGIINNCYSVDVYRGTVGYKGETMISDTSSFYKDNNVLRLRTPISIEGINNTELLEVLNCFVEQKNDGNLRTWFVDGNNPNDNLPRLGDYLTVQYPNITNLTIKNAKKGSLDCVVINWDEVGSAECWEIRYKQYDKQQDDYTILSVDSKPDTLYNLSLSAKYTFGVRSVYNNDWHSGWISQTEMIDLPYWTDIVTEQPDGYYEDVNGNVFISSAEGLTWLSVLVSALNGQYYHDFYNKTVTLTADIDLQGYRWYPIGAAGYCFGGYFDGNGHIISNLYINSNDSYLGLFGNAYTGGFSNITIENGCVKNYDYHYTGGFGGLIGYGSELSEIINCHTNVIVTGPSIVGGLCGWISDQENDATIISNCSSTGAIYGRNSCGGLIGDARGAIVQNSFATGNVNILEGNSNSWYRGGLIGNCMSRSIIRNCYSTGNVEIDNYSGWCGIVIGSPYSNSHTQYAYGLLNNQMNITGPTSDIVTDTSSFYNDNGRQLLVTPIIMDGNTYGDLLAVLNAWVEKENNPMLKTWVADVSNENGGYPVFGDNFEPSCYNPTNVTATNATVVGDETIRTQIAWEQEGDPLSWEILYVAAQQSIDQGTIMPVTSNPCILTNLPVGGVLDIYVRAICSTEERSGWSQYARYIPDKLRWTDVVTSQPDGYYKDNDGNVYISSAEGMAWLSSVMNELNGVQNYTINNIYLTTDINLEAYRWTAINNFAGHVFDGNNHIISGLYCNEYVYKQGLFGELSNCEIKNIIVTDSYIKGLNYCGTIAGDTYNTTFMNCIVNGEVYGVMQVGGVVGRCETPIIYNTAFVGMADSRTDLTLPNCYNGFVGGITGAQYDATIMNVYVAAEIPVSACSGIVAGSGSGTFSNIYAKSYPTSLHLTCDDLETNSSLFTGSGTTWTLNTPPYVNGAFHTDLVDALNAWVEANNTNGEYLHWVADTENQNGGFPMLERLPSAEYQIQPLVQGWNWYSTYIEQDGTDGMLQLKNTLGGNGVQIKSQTSTTQHLPNGSWLGTLTTLENEKSYRVNVSAPTTAVLQGTPVNPEEHPITLQPNWTWIGYPVSTTQSIAAATTGFTPRSGDMIKSQGSSSIYTGTMWFPSLNLEPGQGYLYKSTATENRILTFVQNRGEEPEEATYQKYWTNDIHAFADNMTMITVITENGEELYSSNYELGAFVNGENRGSVRVEYCEPLDRYVAVLTVSGEDGDIVTFGLVNRATENENFSCSRTITFSTNAVLGSLESLETIDFLSDAQETVLNIFPNPIDKDTEFTIEIPDTEKILEVIITNSLGSMIRHEKVLKGNVVRGLSQSGVYNIQIITEKGNNYHGRVIVK